MRIISFKHFDINKILDQIKNDIGDTNIELGYVLLDNKKIKGYCILLPIKKNNIIKIDWIKADPGYGTKFLKKVENALFKKYNKIILNVSIDPNEEKNIVMRRINFYIKNKYRVYDITYRKKYGPLLHMNKQK